jgi:hypothetical protein
VRSNGIDEVLTESTVRAAFYPIPAAALPIRFPKTEVDLRFAHKPLKLFIH